MPSILPALAQSLDLPPSIFVKLSPSHHRSTHPSITHLFPSHIYSWLSIPHSSLHSPIPPSLTPPVPLIPQPLTTFPSTHTAHSVSIVCSVAGSFENQSEHRPTLKGHSERCVTTRNALAEWKTRNMHAKRCPLLLMAGCMSAKSLKRKSEKFESQL